MRSVCTIRGHAINFQPFLTWFAIFHAFTNFFWAKWPWNWKALQITVKKCWKLAWYLHCTDIACAKKLRGLRQKLDPLRVQNGQSLSKYQGFRRKLVCYKGIFLPYFNSRNFVHSICTIRSHAINFQPFLTSFAIFHEFTNFFVPKWP